MPTVYEEIAAERAAQDAKWGGPAHDDTHFASDWIGYIIDHARRAFAVGGFRRQMIRVAALAVAAVESHDRKWPQRKTP